MASLWVSREVKSSTPQPGALVDPLVGRTYDEWSRRLVTVLRNKQPAMTPVHLGIALGPLAAYLLLLGLINYSSRPFVTSGARDASALGIAVSGLVISGPMELFLPDTAAMRFGPFAWLLMLALYGLGMTTVVLLMRPRLLIYNVNPEQLRPVLARVAQELDPGVRWAGDCLSIPRLNIQLHLEAFGGMRCSQLMAAGARQSFSGWRQLELAMARELRETKGVGTPLAMLLIGSSLMIMVGITVLMAMDPRTVTLEFVEMLRWQ